MATASRCSVIRGDVNDKTGEVPHPGGRHRAAAVTASPVTKYTSQTSPREAAGTVTIRKKSYLIKICNISYNAIPSP